MEDNMSYKPNWEQMKNEIMAYVVTSHPDVKKFVEARIDLMEKGEIPKDELMAITIGIEFSMDVKGTEDEFSDFIDYYMK